MRSSLKSLSGNSKPDSSLLGLFPGLCVFFLWPSLAVSQSVVTCCTGSAQLLRGCASWPPACCRAQVSSPSIDSIGLCMAALAVSVALSCHQTFTLGSVSVHLRRPLPREPSWCAPHGSACEAIRWWLTGSSSAECSIASSLKSWFRRAWRTALLPTQVLSTLDESIPAALVSTSSSISLCVGPASSCLLPSAEPAIDTPTEWDGH